MTASLTSPPVLESIVCYVCGAGENTPWAEENGFRAVRCSGCGLVYVNPRPSRASISQAAQSGLHEGEALLDETGQRAPGKVSHYRKRLHALFDPEPLSARPNARWLDLGCGFGEFLEALQLEGQGRIAAVGSEPNERKAAAAQLRGLNVGFRDLALESRDYDFVSMLNVFSHLPDPPEFLRQLRGLLRPGGEVVLQTGNWAELERSAIQDQLHLPDHLSFASERIVSRLLEEAGFSVLRRLRYPMFRPSLWSRLLAPKSASSSVASDLWFRARVSER